MDTTIDHDVDATVEPSQGSAVVGVADPVPARRRAPMSRTLKIGLVVLIAVFIVRFFVAEPVITNGESMSPTLHDGDALVVDHVTYHFRDPRLGEIVVATTPDTGAQVVKRVVALAGDTVGIEDGVLVRNGVPVDEPYADQSQMEGHFWGPITVPAGHVFLLGDSRLTSVDSRHYGPVSLDAVEGRSVGRIWPW